MEHTRITPPAGAAPLPPEMLDTLAHHGLRELLFAPIPKVARALAGFDRDQLGTAIEVMIAMLDAADGDPDAEIEDGAGETIPVIDDPEVPPSEDDSDPDLEEAGLEDSFVTHPANGPGCPISDVGGGAVDDEGEPDDDARGDTSWTEWHTRGRSKDNPGVFTTDGRQLQEDMEEDDADTCLVADDQGTVSGRWFDKDSGAGDPDDAEPDEDREADEGVLPPNYGIDQTAGALPYAPWVDRQMMLPHRDRVRREKCVPVCRPNLYGITHQYQG